MDVQLEDISSVVKKLTFVVPADKVDEELASAYKTLRREVQLPGFRPGKVPRRMLEQRFGRQIRTEVSSKLIGDAFDDAIEERDITPVGAPDIDEPELVAGQDYRFSITIEVKPTLVVEGYDGIKITWDKPEVTDEEVDEQIESMRRQSGSLQVIDEERPAADGDVVDVTFTLRADGREDLVREHVLVSLPDDPYHPFLVEPVRGASRGDTVTADLEIPSDYVVPAWAGSTAAASIELHEIKTIRYPELDDAFAKEMDHDSVEAMRAALRFRIQEAKDRRARDDASRRLIEKVIAANPFDVPSSMIEHRGEALVSTIAQQMIPGMQGTGFSLSDLDEERRNNVLTEAEFAVRRELILEAVVQQEKLTVSDEEKEARIRSMAEETGQRPETIRGYLMKSGGMEDLASRMLEDKALDLLLERAEIVDVDDDPAPPAEAAGDGEAGVDDAADQPAADDAGDDAGAADQPAADDAGDGDAG